MGRDKAKLRLGRRTLLGQIRFIAVQLGYPVRVIRKDLVERCGPLGGVYTALYKSRAERVLFLSCDQPFITLKSLERLLKAGGKRTAAVFIADDEGVGFPFWLRRSVFPLVETQIAEKRYSLFATKTGGGAGSEKVTFTQTPATRAFQYQHARGLGASEDNDLKCSASFKSK
jgi:molybdopterin-guanine dinucleotide biosynthesis protein A